MYRCLCVSTLWNFYILFCVGMLGRNCGWSDMAWQMNPSYLTAGYSDIFLRWISVLWCDMVPNWHLFEMFVHFCIFESILSRWACIIWYSWYLYECFTKMWFLSIKQLWHIVCNHDYCNSSLWHLFVLYLVHVTHIHGLLLFHYHVLVYWSFASSHVI